MEWNERSAKGKTWAAFRAWKAKKYLVKRDAAASLKISKATLYRWAAKHPNYRPKHVTPPPERKWKKVKAVYDVIVYDRKGFVVQTWPNKIAYHRLSRPMTRREINRQFGRLKATIEQILYRKMEIRRERSFQRIVPKDQKPDSPNIVEFDVKFIVPSE